MNNLIVGDLHHRIEEPFFNATNDFLDWVLEQNEYNNEETNLIFLGDIFHKSLPNPNVVFKFMDFINKSKFKEIHIIAGNHGYNKLRNSYAIAPLESIEKVNLYFKPEEINIDGLGKCLMLPYIYDDMREIYENEFNSEKYDYLFGHFADRSLFGEEINISSIQAKNIILGHVHIGNVGKDNYLGVPVITNYAEKDYKPKLLYINEKGKEYIDLPIFLDFYTLDFETDTTDRKEISEYVIYDIINAPSIGEAKEKYKDLTIRNITVKREEIDIETNLENAKGIGDYFKAYCDINSISKSEMTIINKVMGV